METQTSITAAQANEQPEPTKGRILIVEDERPLILMVRRILSKAGFEIVGEVSVDAGLQRLASEPFDLVLLDYMLPDKPGTEMVSVLGQRLKTLPVIMLTGFTDVRLAVEVMKAGVADYVVKDARLEFIRSLPKKIEDVLERFELRRKNVELQRRVDEAERGRIELLNRLKAEVRDPLASVAAGADPTSAEAVGRVLGRLDALLGSGEG